MPKIYFLKWLPASGKSTWAKIKVAGNAHGIVRVNKDDLRAMCHNSVWGRDNEKFICEIRDEIIITALRSWRHVIVDDTNFAPVHLERIKDIRRHVGENRVEVEVKFFDVPVEECIARDALRGDKSVWEKVIREMYEKYLKPQETTIGWLGYPLYQDPSLPKAIIVDIDGTMAKMNGRGPHEYHRVNEDLPHKDIISLVKLLKDHYTIIFLSGRKPSCYDKTLNWLNNHYSDHPNQIQYLFTRETEDDNRKDFIFKQEVYEKYIKGKFYVEFILDDRDQVVEMWRSLGLRCLQVAPWNF